MPSVSDTKVLLSFGSAEGGMEFVMQLRRDIYDKFGKKLDADPYFCYLDAESLRTDRNTTYEYRPIEDINKMDNSEWRANYERAMKYCKTMVLLITKQWLNSKWCWLELNMLVEEAEKSQKKIVVVYWPDARALMAQGLPRDDPPAPNNLTARIDKIRSDKFVITVSGAQTIEGKLPSGHVKRFAYSCTEAECKLITSMIDIS